MDKRLAELADLHNYIGKIDTEVTMVLQSLQWDRKHLLEDQNMVTCSVDSNHRIPSSKKEEHEMNCLLTSQGYSTNITLLPDPVTANSSSLVKFCQQDIQDIISNAARTQVNFKRGPRHSASMEPLSLDRLQSDYTSDERRAIHDAVVDKAPELGDLSQLSLLSAEGRKSERAKSKMEILAELRDMKRRRTKYRVAAKTTNYSDVLRDVIRTQMEVYTGVPETKDKQNFEQTNTRNVKDAQSDHRPPATYDNNGDKYHKQRSRYDDFFKLSDTKKQTSKERDRRKTENVERSSSNISRDTSKKRDREYSDSNRERVSRRHRDTESEQYFAYRKETVSKSDSKATGSRDYKEHRVHEKYDNHSSKDRSCRSADAKIKIEPNSEYTSEDYYSRFYKHKHEKRSNDGGKQYASHEKDRHKKHNEFRGEYKSENYQKDFRKSYSDEYYNDATKRRKHEKDPY